MPIKKNCLPPMCFLVGKLATGKNPCDLAVMTSVTPGSLNSCELSSGPNLPVGALSCTAPPGGDSPPSPGAGFGDGSSEGQSAPSRGGLGDQGEGPSPEGQMPGGTGILIPSVDKSLRFCVCLPTF